jgi:Kdo2-lipid IVA lauroyltransferase/acyltransferase
LEIQIVLIKIAMGLLRLSVFLPHTWQMALGSGMGHLFFYFSRRRRHIARVNLRLCFPELSAPVREQYLRQHFAALGRGLMECTRAWWASPAWCARYVRTEGLEYVQHAQAQGRAVILLSAHFTAVELSLLVDIPTAHLTFRPHDNPILDAMITHNREARAKPTVSRNAIRSMLRVLKQGQVLWIAPDQSYAGSNSVTADFFGIPVATTTLVASLARKSNALVIPFFVYREHSGHYVLSLQAPLENFPQDDEVSNATRLNHLIETQVRRVPSQYFWVHRRLKHSPMGNPYELS